MVKVENMIDLRVKCLEFAFKFKEEYEKEYSLHGIMDCAKSFEDYILKDSKLPDVPFNFDKEMCEHLVNLSLANNQSDKVMNDLHERFRNLEKKQ